MGYATAWAPVPDQSSEVTVSAGPCPPLQALGDRTVLPASFSNWWPHAFLGSWLHPSGLCPCPHIASCVSSRRLFYKDTNCGIRVPLGTSGRSP